MALDSQAVFQGRIEALGLGDLSNAFSAQGWNTLGDFAFATTFTPGQQDIETFVQEVVIPLTGDGMSTRRASLRRLHFEAYAAVVQDTELGRRAQTTMTGQRSFHLLSAKPVSEL